MDEKMVEAIERSARAAAAADLKEGGVRNAGNALNFLAWGLRVRQDHGECGFLELVRAADGTPEAVICPVHGRLDAPAWVPPGNSA